MHTGRCDRFYPPGQCQGRVPVYHRPRRLRDSQDHVLRYDRADAVEQWRRSAFRKIVIDQNIAEARPEEQGEELAVRQREEFIGVGHRVEATAEGCRIGRRHRQDSAQFFQTLVHQEAEERVAVLDMEVERGRLHAEPPAEFAHGHSFGTALFEQPASFGDNLFGADTGGIRHF